MLPEAAGSARLHLFQELSTLGQRARFCSARKCIRRIPPVSYKAAHLPNAATYSRITCRITFRS